MNVPFLRVPTTGLSVGLPARLGCDRTLAGGFGSLILAIVVSQRSTRRKLSVAAVKPVEPSFSCVELAEELVEASSDAGASRVRSDDGNVESFDEACGEDVLETPTVTDCCGFWPVTDLESIDGDGWSMATVVPPIAAKVTSPLIIMLGFLINDRKDSGSMMSCALKGKFRLNYARTYRKNSDHYGKQV